MSGRRSHAERATALTNIYNQLPTINCQGLCADSCGPIQMTPTEHRRIQTRHNITIPDRGLHDAGATCEALTMFGRCHVYPDRPLLCRLWGLLDILPCVYGCQPDRYLTAAEGYELLAQAYEIDGDTVKARQFRQSAAAGPAAHAAVKSFIAGQATLADTMARIRETVPE
jgi:hypothetical protein